MNVRLSRDIAALKPVPGGRAVTVGAFDGLHVGHQQILRTTIDAARALRIPSLVCSFEPMPGEALCPDNPPARLTCFRERFELLADAGVDEFFCARFRTLRQLSPQAFVEELLVERLAARHVVVGHDFRFGFGRGGGLDDLRRAGARYGFDVTVVAPVSLGGERVSSTAIRAALAAGELGKARAMLGRDYSLSGRVIRGLGLGRELGFPTANMTLPSQAGLRHGIYAVRLRRADGTLHDGVANFGRRPTVTEDGAPLLETYVFDFSGDLYGETCAVSLFGFLRGEEKFDGLDALVAQMKRDEEEARALLAGVRPLSELDATVSF